MWFLSCDGDHLEGKQLWLRPGTSHLLGRKHDNNNGGQFHAITHKTVSKQHCELKVDEVRPGDSAHVYKKSKLTITDDSKIGTFVDGGRLRKESKVLNNISHVLQFGNYDVLFRITWRPAVITFTGLTRAARQSADPLATQRAQLESLDIKCITEFLTKDTTHVVSKKRNSSTSLQALVLGRHVVLEGFVGAIAAAAQRSGAAVDLSELEKDFAASWPPELNYLPPPASEPNARPDHDPVFSPSPQRAEMFSKYVFVFADTAQFGQLMPVITGGSGKAVLREVSAPEDDPDFDDFLDYVKSCAGKKGDAVFRMSQYPADKGGVVVVRPSDPSRIGGAEFFERLDLALDQRSVLQSEFLEAILTVDASSLRRALEVDMEDESAGTDSRRDQSNRNQSVPQHGSDANGSAPVQDVSAPKRKGKRNITRQKLTTFDDFDPSQIVKYSPPPSQADSYNSQKYAERSGPDVVDMEHEQESIQVPSTQRSRKRPAESSLDPVQSREQFLDEMFPAANAMKKRKLEQAARSESVLGSGAQETSPNQVPSRPHRKSAKEQEEDIQRIMHERREEQERRRQEDEEKLRNAMDGMNVNELRDLAQVEEMEIKSREPPTNPGNIDSGTDVSSRWKPEWNGRADWKKFKKRRPGQQASDTTNGPTPRRVIVELEQYNPSGSARDDWLDPPSPVRSSQASSRRNHDSSSRHSNGDSSQIELRRRVEKSRRDDDHNDELTELLLEEIGGRPRDPNLRVQLDEIRRSADGTKRAGGGSGLSSPGQSLFDRSRAKRAGQAGGQSPGQSTGQPIEQSGGRPGGQLLAESSARGVRKRPREIVGLDDDDDDDGGLKFRRRRRG
ncbi:hypothetical protein K461DRAFT_315717 [Myriangium duriaei CBS 260.36]|uniref:FHA domain-containing protein n=1 Tax=Myriangium duriaei CBS 260.36 TaxID=1168546 RepID=A0A9P4IRH8_9PEZI|nr:hypothetical protein K461DRAFT_315717 [Myriangium duriaei CBS 260.36]